jgi:AcrR family transcriptional regulator
MTELDIHAQILEAAEERFNQYGYNKTTMAEIARDCDMSAANLYRYFENKLEIATVLAQKCLVDKEVLLVSIVSDASLSANEKLEAFVISSLHYTYNHFDVSPKLGELVIALSDQHPEVVEEHRLSELKLLSELLEQARQTGEFQFEDTADTADAIHTAIMLFYYPLTITMYPIEISEQKAKNLCRLLLSGLQTR